MNFQSEWSVGLVFGNLCYEQVTFVGGALAYFSCRDRGPRNTSARSLPSQAG